MVYLGTFWVKAGRRGPNRCSAGKAECMSKRREHRAHTPAGVRLTARLATRGGKARTDTPGLGTSNPSFVVVAVSIKSQPVK